MGGVLGEFALWRKVLEKKKSNSISFKFELRQRTWGIQSSNPRFFDDSHLCFDRKIVKFKSFVVWQGNRCREKEEKICELFKKNSYQKVLQKIMCLARDLVKKINECPLLE